MGKFLYVSLPQGNVEWVDHVKSCEIMADDGHGYLLQLAISMIFYVFVCPFHKWGYKHL